MRDIWSSSLLFLPQSFYSEKKNKVKDTDIV